MEVDHRLPVAFRHFTPPVSPLRDDPPSPARGGMGVRRNALFQFCKRAFRLSGPRGRHPSPARGGGLARSAVGGVIHGPHLPRSRAAFSRGRICSFPALPSVCPCLCRSRGSAGDESHEQGMALWVTLVTRARRFQSFAFTLQHGDRTGMAPSPEAPRTPRNLRARLEVVHRRYGRLQPAAGRIARGLLAKASRSPCASVAGAAPKTPQSRRLYPRALCEPGRTHWRRGAEEGDKHFRCVRLRAERALLVRDKSWRQRCRLLSHGERAARLRSDSELGAWGEGVRLLDSHRSATAPPYLA